MSSPGPFRPVAPCPRPRRDASFAAVIAVAAGVGLLVSGLPDAGARTFQPTTIPRARYVAPLAPWPAPSYRAKDFTVIRKGDWYHLFYTRVQRFTPDHWTSGNQTVLNERTFGHAISADLENWLEMDSVLTVSGGNSSWDAHHLWAPMVVDDNGTTWMFFTGVLDRNESPTGSDWLPRWQVLGAAYSTDPLLQQWIRLPWPVWAPCGEYGLPGVAWALCNATLPRGTADFRDPHVLPPDPGSGDPWLLYYTARPRTDQFNYVVGVAQAVSPRGPWTDLGALWDTYYPPLNSKIESPHVFRRGSDWHLMFTGDDSTTGIAWHTSHGSPVGPWTTQPSLRTILKDAPDVPYEFDLEPEAWFASEYFTAPTPSGPAEYLAVVHSYNTTAEYNPPPPAAPEDLSIIEFRRMQWLPDGTFELFGPNPVRALVAAPNEVTGGQRVDLAFTCEGGSGRTADLETTFLVDGQAIPVNPESVGLPRTIALGDGVVHLPWDVPGPTFVAPHDIRVRVASQPLRVEASVRVRGFVGGSDPGQVEPIKRSMGGQAGTLAFTTGAVAAGASLALDLPAAGRVRIALYDVAGRHVRTLVDERLDAGHRSWTWDRRDGQGRPVAPGLYFARLESPFGARTARLIAVR